MVTIEIILIALVSSLITIIIMKKFFVKKIIDKLNSKIYDLKQLDSVSLKEQLDKHLIEYDNLKISYDNLIKEYNSMINNKKGVICDEYIKNVTSYDINFKKLINFKAEVKEIERTGHFSKIIIIGNINDIKCDITDSASIQKDIYDKFHNSWIETDKIDFYKNKNDD